MLDMAGLEKAFHLNFLGGTSMENFFLQKMIGEFMGKSSFNSNCLVGLVMLAFFNENVRRGWFRKSFLTQ